MTIAGYLFAVGLLVPIWILSLAGGYILATFMLDRLAKTVLGTHIRHAFVRMAPPKRFDEGDKGYIHSVIIADLASKSGKIRAMLKEGVRD